MNLLRWIIVTAWREMHWSVRLVWIAAFAIPALLPSLARWLNWTELEEMPWWALLGAAIVAFITGLLVSVAARAKGIEDSLQVDLLNEKKAESIHDLLQYVGLTIGDVSDESNRTASDALNRLRNLAAAGAIPVWGTRVYPGEPFDPARPPKKVPKEYWEAALISPLHALESRDPMFLRTTLEQFGASIHHGRVFNGLRVHRTTIRQYFRKGEFTPRPHKPIYRR